MFSWIVRLTILVALAAMLAVDHAGAADTSSTGKHFLWRVTNRQTPFYLLGSIHALRQSDYPLPAVVEEAIGHCQQFIFETDPGADGKFTKLMTAAAKYPAGTTVQSKINPKTLAYLQKISKVRTSEWSDIRPWAIAFFVLSHPGYRQISGAYGIDNYVEAKARKQPHEFAGIESASEHVHVLSDMEDIESEVFLLQALVYADQGPKEFAANVAQWKAGDVQGMYAMELPRIKEAPTIYWRLLDRRNARWIPRIEVAMKSGKPTMVVAGALHFCGSHGVIAMLRARGYKLEQL